MVGNWSVRSGRKRAFGVLAAFAGLAVIFATANPARAAMITKTLDFDDLPDLSKPFEAGNQGNLDRFDPVPLTYGGLTWTTTAPNPSGTGGTGFYYMDGDEWSLTPNGYQAGTVSGNHVAFNKSGSVSTITSDSLFDFNGAYFTGAWANGLEIKVEGRRNGIWELSKTITANNANHISDPNDPNTNGPLKLSTFDWLGIDGLKFTSLRNSTGYPHDASNNTNFAMDNFTFTTAAVPEPSSMILLGTGLASLMGYGWRRKRREAGSVAA